MAREQGDPAEAGRLLSSSSPSKKIEGTEGLPEGRSSAAQRRVGGAAHAHALVALYLQSVEAAKQQPQPELLLPIIQAIGVPDESE